MKRSLFFAGLTCLFLTTFSFANNPAVEKKLNDILKDVEAKIKTIDGQNKAIDTTNVANRKAFDEMKMAVKGLAVPKKLTLAETKVIRSSLAKLVELKNAGKLHLPDFQPELDALSKLDLSDFTQTQKQVGTVKGEIAKMNANKTARGADTMTRTNPKLASRVDGTDHNTVKVFSQQALDEQKACPTCDQIAAETKKLKDQRNDLDEKIKSVEDTNKLMLKRNEKLAEEFDEKLKELEKQTDEAVKKVFSPKLTNGRDDFKGKHVTIDGRRIGVSLLTKSLYRHMRNSILSTSAINVDAARSQYGLELAEEKFQSYEQSLSSIAKKKKSGETGLFSKLHEYVHRKGRAKSHQLKDAVSKDFLQVELKLESSEAADIKKLDELHDSFKKLVGDRKYMNVAPILTNSMPILNRLQAQQQEIDLKIARFDDCQVCRRDTDNSLLKSRHAVPSRELILLLREARDHYKGITKEVRPKKD